VSAALATPAPTLVIGWGNPSRGDDALGWLFVQRLEAELDRLPGVELQTDFQLQVEHALDMVGRERVLFVDASSRCAAHFEASALAPERDASFTTHALSPAALMEVFGKVHGVAPPACTLLAIHGEAFELGAGVSAAAEQALEAALGWARQWLAAPAGNALAWPLEALAPALPSIA
jgi:hydrogenase maturation protease